MHGVTPIHRGWQLALNDIVSAAREQLVIAAPFITDQGAHSITAMIDLNLREQGRIDIITDLSPSHVCDGVLEPAAIQHMMAANKNAALWHMPRLHAKVYLADHTRAIVTSGNLTAGAFYRNVEYGFDIVDSDLISIINSDLMDIKFLGVVVGSHQLAEYVEVANEVRESYQRQQNTVDPALKRAFTNAIQIAEDDLIRLRLAGGAMHTVFAKTIISLLRKHGPLKTNTMHQLIQQLHPDLCDDLVDRVIDGKHYGKKWKHAVRTAQQQNKRLGLINNEGEFWHVTGQD